jgi:hypothetical protein
MQCPSTMIGTPPIIPAVCWPEVAKPNLIAIMSAAPPVGLKQTAAVLACSMTARHNCHVHFSLIQADAPHNIEIISLFHFL